MNAFTEVCSRFACPDWWDRLKAGKPPMAPVPLNKPRAAMALAFFDRLRLPDVPGNPPLREAAGDWFRDIVAAFCASEDPETRERMVWELLCMVPKKSSKTTYTAALALTELFLEETPNGRMLLIGPSQNISNRLFDQAQGMIRLEPMLKKAFKVQDHVKTITRYKTGTSLEVKTFDTTIVTGEIPLLTIIDELHELGKKNGAQQVMQQIRGGSITMTGGRLMMITTQSDKEPAGIWRAELQKARAIRDGKTDSTPIMLPVLYEFPEAQQRDEAFWRDRRNWHLVLPNLDRSISRKRLEDDYDNNGAVSPEAERIWTSQHLNIEIGLGLHSERWIGADYWEQAARPGLDLAEIIRTSEVCVIGLDGGGLDDLLGLSVLGRHAETKVWQHWGKAWADRSVLTLRKSIAPDLEDLERAGELTFVDNLDEEAIPEIVAICGEVRDAGKLPEQDGIGMDPEGVAAIVDALIEADFEIEDIRSVSQGYKLNAAIKGTPVKLKNGSMVHGGQRIMSWCVGNAKCETRGNAVIVTKAKSGSAKIDPLMALFNGVMLMSWNPVAGGANLITADKIMARGGMLWA